MKLIVGLGNVGPKYNLTKHNIGFHYLNKIIGESNFNNSKYGYIYKDNNIIYLKPNTFMNNSGISVSYYMNYFKIDINNILIIYDDLDLNTGVIRIKKDSGHGGHNGIRSINQHLKTNDYLKLKVGINKVHTINNSKYVLSKFNSKELELINSKSPVVENVIKDFIDNKDYLFLANKYNGNE